MRLKDRELKKNTNLLAKEFMKTQKKNKKPIQ